MTLTMTVMMRKMPGERQREIDRETEGVYMGYPYPNFCLYAFLGAENRERNRERERERGRESERERDFGPNICLGPSEALAPLVCFQCLLQQKASESAMMQHKISDLMEEMGEEGSMPLPSLPIFADGVSGPCE